MCIGQLGVAMVLRASPRRDRLLQTLGANVRRWRKVNGMTATELAERATVTRATLRSIEEGAGSARLDSVLAVLVALGIADEVVDATDPYRSPAGRARIDDLLRTNGRS
jgi:transcriptional regulator with XRE-family HTH domain